MQSLSNKVAVVTGANREVGALPGLGHVMLVDGGVSINRT